MKTFYSLLIAMVAVVVFAAVAVAKPPFWNDQVNNTGRFKVLSEFGGAAVFDKETGLVWEQNPNNTERTWFGALGHCYPKQVGGRKGWRLPTIEELASLVDTSNLSPALPTDHPFALTSAQEDCCFWSATTLASFTASAWLMGLLNGDVFALVKADNSTFVWCVRGGQGVDGVQ